LLDTKETDSTVNDVLNTLTEHAFLIKIGPRIGKNKSVILTLYQINKTLAPRWNLPVSRRGVIEIKGNLLEALFHPNYSAYRPVIDKYLSEYNPPFKSVIPTLF
jgi:hypothetical protein